MRPSKIVVVEWIDASWDSESIRPRAIKPLVRLFEFGLLIREDPDSVTLAMEFCPSDGRARHTVSIPRAGIVRIKTVGRWKDTKNR